jgi:NDP-sugar pyrophosphorylase family protein
MSGEQRQGLRAVVLAGGKGTRLRPYTTVLPKPLMPIGDRPILEIVLKQLAAAGFDDITMSVGHLSELIQVFFGDGKRHGFSLEYATEDTPLGTMGPLAFIERLGENFLVMNGDILTDLNLRELWQAHLESGATLTVATHRREVKIDFGVLRCGEAGAVVGFEEKPQMHYDVSMGIYVLNRRCLELIPRDRPYGFDHLMHALLERGDHVQAVPHAGQWLDIGRPEDYERAQDLFGG